MSHALKIRFATASDTPLILEFIKELAEYERLLHEVVATEEQLLKTLFGSKAYAEVIIGYLEKKPVSFALFFHNYSTFLAKPGLYLEDLYVKPEARGQGIGQIMLVYLAKLAKERGCGRFEWWVLDWNETAIKFYEKLGAKPMDEWTVHRVSGQALDELAASYTELAPMQC
ncbi:GNAT family N-acetyltransferase [Legionella resiliens]|uniref:GNAT family N-acetyltransferase n=1 Tax=Legionella resiliens TaxID=2905958 RepID=A0ABS8WWT1_9GAMM|nr:MULTISPECIES: GNAT family N-acetyltransferase [unclassified Legionella]MCE0721774.1 GNAT family N-acetyltransferase [Legionella sp. 9fVS26]MCE3530928.1 GNAT family N-acetyltransferase [Legionella sp. 8cVS16]